MGDWSHLDNLTEHLLESLGSKERAATGAEVRGRLTPDTPIGSLIENRALAGHQCRMLGVTMLVEVRSADQSDAGEYHLYALALAGAKSLGDYLLVAHVDLMRPAAHFTEQTSSPQDPPTPVTLSSIEPDQLVYRGTQDPPTTETLGVGYIPESVTGKFQRIGVYDYESCVRCLRTNFKMIFGEDALLTDSQDMIQRLAAEIQNLRRAKDA